MKKIYIALVVLTAFCSFNLYAQTAYDAYKKGDYQKSASLYSDMINKNTSYAPGYYNRGLAYLGAGNISAAIDDFTAAIKLVPNNAQYYFARGMAYCHGSSTLDLIGVDTLETALKDFKKANELAPSADYLYSMGNVCISLEYYDQAEGYLTSAIKMTADNPTLYYARACAYFGLNDRKACRSDFEQFLQLNNGKLGQDYVDTANRLLNGWCKKAD